MSSLLLLAVYVLSFLSIGLWFGLQITHRKRFPREFLYICSLGVSLFIFGSLFYVYSFSPKLGHAVLLGLLAVSPLLVALIIRTCRRSATHWQLIRCYYLPPLIIISVVFLLFGSLLYGCRFPPPPMGSDTRRPANETFCVIQNMPLDNGLPLMYATFTLNNQEGGLVLDWTIADRPPLQIGTSMPIVDLLQDNDPRRLANYYNVFSIFLQLSWIGAIWGIFQWLKVRRRVQVLLFMGLSATGFFYLNSIFVWPKLLAAALVLTAIVPFIGKKLDKQLLRYVPLSAVLISLGLMAHSSVLFTLIPAALIFAYKLFTLFKAKKIRLSYKPLLLGGALALLILAPWQIYKSTITTSDRLVKYHFADVTAYEDKRGTLETIIQEYQKLTFDEWLYNKTQNVKALFVSGFHLWVDCDPTSPQSLKNCSDWKAMTFFSTLFALELYSLGFLAVIYQAIRRRLDSFDKETWLIVGGGLLAWVLLMFHPGGTVVHQGSYATMLLLFILLGRSLGRLPVPVLAGMTFLQLLIFYNVWIRPFHYF